MKCPKEIEIKILLNAQNAKAISDWLSETYFIKPTSILLKNSYFDTPARFFSSHKMGLRVREKNKKYELTLKTKGEGVGGLHIHPEYHLALPDEMPDFVKLVQQYALDIPEPAKIQAELSPLFTTNFSRSIWQIQINQSQIEIALDQGEISSAYLNDKINELELELISGDPKDLFEFLLRMPKYAGMRLGTLNKAHRGYLLCDKEKLETEIQTILQTDISTLPKSKQSAFNQYLIDMLLFSNDERILHFYQQNSALVFNNINAIEEYIHSENYFIEQINNLILIYSEGI